jgi:hypothetical protein
MTIVHGGYNRYIDTSTGTNPKVPASGADVPAGAAIVLGILNRSGTAVTVTGISDPVNGAWDLTQWSAENPTGTLISGPNGGFQSHLYCRANSGAQTGGANRIVTVTFSAGISAQICIGWTRDDAATLVVGGVGTPFTSTPTTITNWDTAPFALPDAGCALGFTAWANGQTIPTMDGAGETLRTTVSDPGSYRTNIISETASGAGNYGFETTAATATTGTYHQFGLTLSLGAVAPVITDVDTDNTITLEQQNVVTNVANEDEETIEVRQSGYVYTLVGDAASADMLDLDSGGSAPHAGSALWAVVNGDEQEDDLTITIVDEAGTASILVATPSLDPDEAIQLTPPAQSGDYVRWRVTSGTYDETDFTLNNDLTFQMPEGLLTELTAETATLELQAWDSDDGTWGAWQTISFVPEEAVVADGGRDPRRGFSRGFLNMGRGRG